MFNIIVAMNRDSVIGVKEYGVHGLPWPMLREDLRHFRALTANSVCIVGYNTAKTLTSKFETETRKIIVVETTFTDALAKAYAMNKSVFVIGGAYVYAQAWKHPDLEFIYCTFIDHSYPAENEAELIYFPIDCHKLGHTIDTRSYHDDYVNLDMTFETIKVSEMLEPKLKTVIQSGCNMSDPYYDLVKRIMTEGIDKTGRNGNTRSIFGHQLVYDLNKGYPINTLKRCYPKAIFEELMWMIRGQTDVVVLQSKGVHVWDGNSTEQYLKSRGLPYRAGDIGPGYGFQFRHAGAKYVDCLTEYEGTDQLQAVIDAIKTDPNSRRMIINLWDPNAIDQMALPPCHMVYQFAVNDNKLDCHLFQRSWDVMLGWNTSTAALLTYLLANHCGLNPGKLVHSISDCHIYHSHFDGVKELLARKSRPLPKLTVRVRKDNIEDYEFSDVTLEGYLPAPPIKLTMQA